MKNKRTQDLYQTFYDAGQIYAYKYNSLIKNETFFKKNTDFIKLGYLDAIDIDNVQDFKDSINLYKFIKNNER
jgi:CMP-N-acetylneuraminic acid synthetase